VVGVRYIFVLFNRGGRPSVVCGYRLRIVVEQRQELESIGVLECMLLDAERKEADCEHDEGEADEDHQRDHVHAGLPYAGAVAGRARRSRNASSVKAMVTRELVGIRMAASQGRIRPAMASPMAKLL